VITELCKGSGKFFQLCVTKGLCRVLDELALKNIDSLKIVINIDTVDSFVIPPVTYGIRRINLIEAVVIFQEP
jgi:hypothetical protein